MSLITELVFFGAAVYLLHAILSWLLQKQRSLATFSSASIPGPKPAFWTGNSREYIGPSGYHDALDRWSKQYGTRFGYYRSDQPVLVLSDVDDVNEVVNKLGKSFPNRQRPIVPVEPFASSLLDSRGDTWRHSRRILTPPFTPHKIAMQSTKSVINYSVGRLLDELDKGLDLVDIALYMKSATLDIISRLAFNMDETDVYEKDSHLRKITAAIMEDGDNVVLTWCTYLPFLKKLVFLLYESFGKYTLNIIQHVEKCIADYYSKKEENGHSGESTTKANILDFMLEQKAQGNLNELQVMGNAITILIAGYDTTATGLTFAFYLLAKHQDIQSRLREEIVQTRAAYKGDNGENYCQFDENRCELLDRVWYESLRLYPPVVTFMTRQLDDNLDYVELSKTGLKITRDMTVQVPVWTIHHNPEYWPRPNTFDPMRDNLPLPGASKQSRAFFTFGAGPRNCIGSNLALTEARAVISAILQKYKIELASEQEIDPKTGLLKLKCFSTVIVHPTKHIYLKLTPISAL